MRSQRNMLKRPAGKSWKNSPVEEVRAEKPVGKELHVCWQQRPVHPCLVVARSLPLGCFASPQFMLSLLMSPVTPSLDNTHKTITFCNFNK